MKFNINRLTTHLRTIAPFALMVLWSFGCSSPSADSLPDPDISELEPFAAEKIKALKKEVEKKPNDAGAWGTLAMNLDIHDLKNAAVPCYEKAIALAPENFRWHYYRAMVADEIGAPETLSLYEKARAANPDYPPLLYRYGKALFLANEPEQARQMFTAVAEADDAEVAAYGCWQLAEMALAQDDLEKSLEWLLKSMELNPNIREVRSLLATVYTRLGKPKKAELQQKQLPLLPERLPIPDRFVEQLQAEGVSAFWFSQHGRRHLDFGNYQAALEAFQMEHRIKPSADSYNSLGMTYQYLGGHAEAATHFRNAIQQREDYVEAFNNLAVSLYSMLQKQAAVDTLKRAIAIEPEYAEPYLNLGTFYIIEGATAQAIEVFSTAMVKAEYDIRIGGRLAWLLATSRKTALRKGKKAVRLAEEVCEITGNLHPDNLDILAAAYAEAGAFAKAIETASKASKLAHDAKMANLAKQIDYRLSLYKKGQPFRDPEL